MIKTRINNEYKDIIKIFGGGALQKEITKVWSREAGKYVYESEVEYTGVPPIEITTDGSALLDYRIYGNTVRNGTPTPENPVDVVGCGVRTENIMDVYSAYGGNKNLVYSGVTFNFSEEPQCITINGQSTTMYPQAQIWGKNGVLPFENGKTYAALIRTTNKPKNSFVYMLIQGCDAENNWSTIKTVASDMGGISFSVSKDYVDFRNIFVCQNTGITYDNMKAYLMIVEGSTSPETYEPYGYKLPMVVHSELKDIGDTVSVNDALWDIVDYNNDFTRATLLRHETMPEMVYSAKQAIFAFPSGLAAGDYHFTITEHTWVAEDVGKTLTFTLTQAVPEGGQLVLNGAYNKTLVGTTISSYASPTTTTAIETVTITEGDSGTDLGSLTNAGTPASNINSLQKALLGSNEWKTSAQRQYLNSDKAAGSVWIPQTIFDRPPVWAINTVGFMNGLDEDFLSCVADTTYVTVRNAISDDGGTDTLTDKFYLPSRTEIFGNNEIANTPEGALYQYYVNATNADRIKYRANTARSWRLRTPTATYANNERSVNTTGALGNLTAYLALGFAPACHIDLTKLSNSWLQNNMYKTRATTTPVYIGEKQLNAGEYVSYGEQKIYRDVSGTLTSTDPPVPLPEIPTIKGETIIDYDGELKPSQMYIKYRR